MQLLLDSPSSIYQYTATCMFMHVRAFMHVFVSSGNPGHPCTKYAGLGLRALPAKLKESRVACRGARAVQDKPRASADQVTLQAGRHGSAAPVRLISYVSGPSVSTCQRKHLRSVCGLAEAQPMPSKGTLQRSIAKEHCKGT
eukprot:351179-Chlamydomonas_euryale.AAC.3